MSAVVSLPFVGTNPFTSYRRCITSMSEEHVLKYCSLHHLLLYLQSKNEDLVTSFAERWVGSVLYKMAHFKKVRSQIMGKFLIYTMISKKYQWSDVAVPFLCELFAKETAWMAHKREARSYAHYFTTDFIADRSKEQFNLRRVRNPRLGFMSQIWFFRNHSMETLHSYNNRLGRPRRAVRDGVVSKSKAILKCDSWGRYLSDFGAVIGDEETVDHLLRFSVYNSWKKGYYKRGQSMVIDAVPPPRLRITSVSEAEKANAALFAKPTIMTEGMGWIPPISCKLSSIPLSKRSGPRKRFNLSTINAMIASNGQSQNPLKQSLSSSVNLPPSRQRPQSLSSRSSNPINPDSDDSFSRNRRSGPRKTASLSFQERMRNAIKPSDRFKESNVVSVSDDLESVTGYDSQSTVSTDTRNETKE